MTTDPTPDAAEREKLAQIIRDAQDPSDPRSEEYVAADAILAAGFRRAPEPARESPPDETPDGRGLMGLCEVCGAPFYEGDDWKDWAEGVMTHRGECPVPPSSAQPAPQQGGDPAAPVSPDGCGWDRALAVNACFKVFDDGDPHGKAYVVCPDGTMIGLGSCEGDMDFRRAQFIAKACNAALAATKAAPVEVAIGSAEHVALWRAINEYADAARSVYGSTKRQEAVARVEAALAAALAAAGKAT